MLLHVPRPTDEHSSVVRPARQFCPFSGISPPTFPRMSSKWESR
nr:MAG TPA: hypothetical protein [Caudoviricetes sp.]